MINDKYYTEKYMIPLIYEFFVSFFGGKLNYCFDLFELNNASSIKSYLENPNLQMKQLLKTSYWIEPSFKSLIELVGIIMIKKEEYHNEEQGRYINSVISYISRKRNKKERSRDKDPIVVLSIVNRRIIIVGQIMMI